MDPSVDEIQKFMDSIGGAAGLGALGLASCVTHGLVLILRTPRFQFLGRSHPFVVFALGWASNVMGLKLTGLSWWAALLHGNTAALIQTLATGKAPTTPELPPQSS
jgi:hypothetical protein